MKTLLAFLALCSATSAQTPPVPLHDPVTWAQAAQARFWLYRSGTGPKSFPFSPTKTAALFYEVFPTGTGICFVSFTLKGPVLLTFTSGATAGATAGGIPPGAYTVTVASQGASWSLFSDRGVPTPTPTVGPAPAH